MFLNTYMQAKILCHKKYRLKVLKRIRTNLLRQQDLRTMAAMIRR